MIVQVDSIQSFQYFVKLIPDASYHDHISHQNNDDCFYCKLNKRANLARSR